VTKKKPESELLALLRKHDATVVDLALGLRSIVLEAAPSANETVYDAGYTISDAFSFSDRWQDSFCMVTVYSKHVNLMFTHGARLSDPKRQLRGSGKQIRHLQVRTREDLDSEVLHHFLAAAIAQSQADLLDSEARRRLPK
jgi:hypothetical protein